MGEKDFDVQGFARDIHELLVLATLRDGAKHGYQIALDLGADSGGLFQFKHGTLYPILHRLEEEGYITGTWSTGSGRRRKTYGLTARGRRHLTGETGRVEEITHRLLGLLQGPEGTPA